MIQTTCIPISLTRGEAQAHSEGEVAPSTLAEILSTPTPSAEVVAASVEAAEGSSPD